MNIDHKWASIWCTECRAVRALVVDELPANQDNPHDGLDLICADCHFILATLHACETPTNHRVLTGIEAN